MAPRSVRLTSPERVLLPHDGTTKQDLFDYYRSVGPVLCRTCATGRSRQSSQLVELELLRNVADVLVARVLELELNGALSNPRLRVELPPLKALLARVGKQASTADTSRLLGRRQGAVLEAATAVLRRSEKPLRARDVHAAVEAMLGVTVPPSSVNEPLSTHAREGDLRFRRVGYGMY